MNYHQNRKLRVPGAERHDVRNFEKTRTQQQYRDECDINVIMRNYRDKGIVPQGTAATAKYGDFSSVDDYLQAQLVIMNANDQFNQLASEVRARFNNDPAQFLTFATDIKNLDAMNDLGMLTEEASKRIQTAKAASGEPKPTGEAK